MSPRGSKVAQNGCTMAQDGPRWPKVAPRRPQDSLQIAPRRPKDGTKMAPRCHDAARCSQFVTKSSEEVAKSPQEHPIIRKCMFSRGFGAEPPNLDSKERKALNESALCLAARAFRHWTQNAQIPPKSRGSSRYLDSKERKALNERALCSAALSLLMLA